MTGTGRTPVEAPFFEDLRVGQIDADAPPMTLTEGVAATHQAIVGDRLRLPLDRELSRRVLGSDAVPAHPQLVCDVAIGQSTLLTRRVIGNLFYRGLTLSRLPSIGDTLATVTEVVGLRQNTRRPGRPATGLAVLRVRTTDQRERPVLDFWRCAMLPLRNPESETGMADDVATFGVRDDSGRFGVAVAGWDLAHFASVTPGPRLGELAPGDAWRVEGGDVVSSAPELARLTLNVAFAHSDRTATSHGERLVYGGHTIGIAAAQISRALPSLVAIVAWHSCDHLGPVFEGDTLHGQVEVEGLGARLEGGAGLVDLRARVTADRERDAVPVLDWSCVGVVA